MIEFSPLCTSDSGTTIESKFGYSFMKASYFHMIKISDHLSTFIFALERLNQIENVSKHRLVKLNLAVKILNALINKPIAFSKYNYLKTIPVTNMLIYQALKNLYEIFRNDIWFKNFDKYLDKSMRYPNEAELLQIPLHQIDSWILVEAYNNPRLTSDVSSVEKYKKRIANIRSEFQAWYKDWPLKR